MDADYSFSVFEFELFHSSVVTLALETSSACVHLFKSDSLNVVLLPRPQSNLHHLVANYFDFSSFGSRPKKRRLATVLVLQSQAVNTNTRAGRYVSENTIFELWRAKESRVFAASCWTLFQLWIREISPRLCTLNWYLTALNSTRWHRGHVERSLKLEIGLGAKSSKSDLVLLRLLLP